MGLSFEPVLKELEKLVHNHIRLVDATRKALAKARRSGDVELLNERSQRLMEVGEKLSKLLRTINDRMDSIGAALDNETRERMELLLFFLSEVGFREESSLWSSIARHRDKLKDFVAIEVADYMARRAEELRALSMNLLEKVKSLERVA